MLYLNNEYYARLTTNACECDNIIQIHYKEFCAAVSESRSDSVIYFDGYDGNRHLIIRNDANEEINGSSDFTLIVCSVPYDEEKTDVCESVSFCNFDTYEEAFTEMMHISVTDRED
jgi:hypothetical protein